MFEPGQSQLWPCRSCSRSLIHLCGRKSPDATRRRALIYLATIRKDGNQSKAAPVWFTISVDNNAILIQTGVARLEGQAHQTRQHGSRVDRFRNRSGLYR